MGRDDTASGNDLARTNGVSRRDFLKLSAGATLLGAGGSALAACGSSTTGTTTTTGTLPPAKIPRGGTLTAALSGGDPSDTVDGQQGVDNVDFARIVSLYDALAIWDINARPVMALAESIEPNSTNTKWTIKLRPGIEFHNGKTLTARDVIYSYQRVQSNNLGGASSIALCDMKNATAPDDLTVIIPCTSPFATFVSSIIGYYYYLSIIPEGFSPVTKANPKITHAIGTGPFKFESFTPGRISTFSKNPNYWQSGLPYVDSLVINDYVGTDAEVSQVNALISGEADCANLLSIGSIKTVESGGGTIVIAKSAGFTPITMRIDTAPFSDVRLRQALRLCVDREEMLKVVFGGYGRIGNDIFAPLDPEYDTSIPQRVQDLDTAKGLLKAADLSNITVTMQTSDIAQGTLEMATVLKEQASLIGVNIALDVVPTLYTTEYLSWTFAEDYWYYSDYLPQVSEATLFNSPFNETHFASNASTAETLKRPNNPLPPNGIGEKYLNYYNQAVATSNKSVQTELAHEMQLIDYNYGGYIIPYFPPVIDGHSKSVGGVVPSLTGLSLGNYGFHNMYKLK